MIGVVNVPHQDPVNGQTGFLLKKVSSASFEALSEIVARRGLHPMHFGMLMMIGAEEPVSQQELSRRTGIDTSTMVAKMDILHEQGLVERERKADDRRSYDIRLSTTGRKLLGELLEEAKEHGDRFFSPLTGAERAQLHALLAKLAASLE